MSGALTLMKKELDYLADAPGNPERLFVAVRRVRENLTTID